MEGKNNLSTMIKLKNKREKEIKEDLVEREDLDIIINDIKYLGSVKFIQELDGQKIEEERDIYLLVEEKDGRVLYRYYDENMKLVAYEDSVLEELMATIDFEDKDQTFLKQIDQLDKENAISLADIEEKLEKISDKLGISIDEIKEIKELDLNQKIKNKETLDKDEALNLDIKETTKLNQNIKGQTLANKLGINDIELPNGQKLTDGEKLAVVSTSSSNKYTDTKSSQAYRFVVIRKNGEAIPLNDNILVPEESRGINQIKEDLTINNNGNVNKETNVTSYRIVNGNRNEFLKIGNDEFSGREIKYSEFSRENGEYVTTELETDRDIYINDNVRQYLKDRTEGRKKANNTIERSEKHDSEKKDITLVDNNPNNDLHIHVNENDYISNTDITWRQFANELGYRGEGSIERAQKEFKRRTERNPSADNNQIIEMAIEESNEDFRNQEMNR